MFVTDRNRSKGPPDLLPHGRSSALAPKVTIGVPVSNGAQYLREALESVLGQRFTDFEIVISDNASTDDTEAICREYVVRDARIRYVRQRKNIGGARNFRFVLDEARGEYFKWLAHDDYVEPGFLDAVVGYLDAHADVVVCTTDVKIIDGAGDVVRIVRLDALRDGYDWGDARRSVVLWSNMWRMATNYAIYGMYCTRRLRRCHIHEYGLWGLACASEYPWLVQVALQGRIVALPIVSNVWRTHGDSSGAREYKTTFWLKPLLNSLFLLARGIRTVAGSRLDLASKIDLLVCLCFHEIPILAVQILDICARGVRRRLGRLLAKGDGAR